MVWVLPLIPITGLILIIVLLFGSPALLLLLLVTTCPIRVLLLLTLPFGPTILRSFVEATLPPFVPLRPPLPRIILPLRSTRTREWISLVANILSHLVIVSALGFVRQDAIGVRYLLEFVL